jgi:hypothetical protein
MRHRPDRNHAEIVRALRQAGASVQVLSQVGDGCPDIAVGLRNATYLMEIKDGNAPKGQQKLTEAEFNWHSAWRGQVAIVTSIKEAFEVLGL